MSAGTGCGFRTAADVRQELYHEGAKKHGTLSTARGEAMQQYVGRRRRWWARLKKLDDQIGASEAILADMLLEGAGLDETQKLLILDEC